MGVTVSNVSGDEQLQIEIIGVVPYAQVPDWLIRHRGVSDAAKVLYAAVMRFNGCTEIRPSRATLAEMIGKSVRTVSRLLEELEGEGIVQVIQRYDNGRQVSNVYRIRFSDPAWEAGEGVRNVTPPDQVVYGGGVSEMSPPGVSEMSHEVKKKEVEKKTTIGAADRPPLPENFGSDPDGPPKQEGRKPKPGPIALDWFLQEWRTTVISRPEYSMLPRVNTRVGALTWLNTHYFQPKYGDPHSVDHVLGLIDDFMYKVRTDQITPATGYSAWQTFIYNVNRLSPGVSAPVDLPGTIVL